MALMKDALLANLDYCDWANRLLLEACSGLTQEQLERDLRASHRSIVETMRHIYYSERVWLKRLREDALPPLIEMGDQRRFQDPPPEPGLDDMRRQWPELSNGLRKYLEELEEAELGCEISGNDSSFPRWKVFLHMVNHSTLHRGQVMSMLRQLGHRPPGTDLLGYYLLPSQDRLAMGG